MVALGHGVGYMVRLLAYSICARRLVLVEGEEVSIDQIFGVAFLVVGVYALYRICNNHED
jgi:hypothetical protein